MDLTLLSRGVKAELRGLSLEQADIVAAHLAAAAQLVDTDPARAYAHADAARRRASRLPVVREAAGTTAYAAGEFAAALNEFRALRRMTGSDDFIAVMADCERGLGRPHAALRLVKEALASSPPIAARVELKLVEAGAREALDQREEAVRLLRHEIELVGARGPKNARARLRYFFAQLLTESGDTDEAEKWFAAAARLDPDDETGASEALAELQGISIEFDDTEEPEPADQAGPAVEPERADQADPAVEPEDEPEPADQADLAVEPEDEPERADDQDLADEPDDVDPADEPEHEHEPEPERATHQGEPQDEPERATHQGESQDEPDRADEADLAVEPRTEDEPEPASDRHEPEPHEDRPEEGQ